MRILLTGATGFTGSHVLKMLRERRISPRCLLRTAHDSEALIRQGVEIVHGDIGDPLSMRAALQGIEVLINTASLGFGHAPALLDAVDRSTLRCAVFISTTAIFTSLSPATKEIRIAAEERIAASRVAYTILRPTMIYGTRRDRNISRVLRLVSRTPLIPIVGSGTGLMQPIHVDDLAAAIVRVCDSRRTARKTYNVSGGTVVTFRELIELAAAVLGKRIRPFSLPLRPAIRFTTWAEKVRLPLPIKSEQLLRLEEDKAFSFDEAAADFEFAPRGLAEGLRSEAIEMGLLPS